MRDIDFLHKMKLIDSWYSMIQIPDGRENSTFLQEIMNTNGVEQTDITMFYILSVYRCISNMEAYVNNIRTIKKAMGQKWFAGLINGYHSLIPTTL